LNTDEELLTRALDRAAARITAETLRPLAEPATAPPRLARARRAGWNARLAPAAAAVAVVLAVGVALLVAGGTHRPGQAGGTPAVGAAGPPRYYAEVEGPELGGPHAPGPVAVVVRSTATGAVVARIPAPRIAAAPKAIPLSVAAGPDDRTFYALYANWGRVPADFWVYRFRITSSGRATTPAAISGGLITGQNYLGNVGGFVVSPDGSRLALAVASGPAGTQRGLATEILVIDLRTGAHTAWRGGMDRPGQVFGILNLSWTRDGRTLAYRGQWCAPRGLSYGMTAGADCSTRGRNHQPLRAAGTDVVREISVTPAGGTLASGPVLRAPAKVSEPEPVLIDPAGKDLITIVDSAAPGTQNVVRVSIATGRVTSVLGSVPRGLVRSRGDFLAVDPTGRYALIWMAGNVTASLVPLHGWVHGAYHQLAPTFGRYGARFQMTW
jgi:hypothetical protein